MMAYEALPSLDRRVTHGVLTLIEASKCIKFVATLSNAIFGL